MGGAGRGGPRLLIVKVVCLFFVLALHTRTHTSFSGRGGGKHSSVGPVGGAAIAGLAALGFLLHAVGLIALTGTTLSILCEVMVQQLGVGLLVRWQDVHEGSRGVARSPPGVQGPRPAQCRGQAEGRRCPRVEALLVK